MDIATLVPIVLQTSIALTVFALGLGVRVDDLVDIVRRPSLLARSLIAMHLVMPVVAVVLVRAFDLQPAVGIALIALAVSPVPPILPKKQLKAGGSASYVIGLLVAASLAAIVYVPLALTVLEGIFGLALQVPASRIAKLVLVTVLVPLAAGLAVRRMAPGFAGRVVGAVNAVSMLLLALIAVAIMIKAWPGMVTLIGNGTLAAYAVFIVIGLSVGHWLGGPVADDRTVLAFAAASRHPGVALAIAGANFPEQKLVMPAVLLYLLAGAIVSVPYMRWRRERMSRRSLA